MKIVELLLRRKNKILVDSRDMFDPGERENEKMVATMMKNIENLGYTFSKELFDLLSCLDSEFLKELYKELVENLKMYVGSNIVYKPMYPNFPESVMERDDFELYFNAIIHYWSGGKLYPVEKKEERLPLFDDTKVKVLDVGDWEDVRDIFSNLCSSNTSLSETDKNDLEWIMKNVTVRFPDEIPLKENCALIGKIYLQDYPYLKYGVLSKYFKTATDVLRLIVAMSDGDISLAQNTKFKSMKRKHRRLIMKLLMDCPNLKEDMNRYRIQWIRVGEKLHPGEFSHRYDNVKRAFHRIRSGETIQSFAGKVDNELIKKNYIDALELLKTRPGELARKLDYLLRTVDDKQMVIDAFKEVAKKVSSSVLLQVRQHFINREGDLKYRVFFPKGSLARVYCIENDLPKIDDKYCREIVMVCSHALINIYSERELMGNVYLSEDFKNYVVPFSQRSASDSLKTIVRGSRIPIDKEKKAVRAFIWWTNLESSKDGWSRRVDLDLSACMFDEDWNYIEHVSYTNLKSSRYQACHSGDITDGQDYNGDGVSEFIDIDIDSVIKNGARYVVYQVYSYTGQKFSDWDHAMFGWMNREDVKSGEIYEPKTVEQKMNLTSQSRVAIPVIFDCVNREFIWCDMNLSINGCHRSFGGNNVESNLKGVAATCYAIVNMKKSNLYDLISLNVNGRGNLVDNKENADIVFDIDDGITPFDTEVFMGEYL